MNKNFLFLFLISTTISALDEFLYPVDTIIHNEKEKFCVLHQKGNCLELWFWDPVDNTTVKGLLSSFIPAGLTVLPDKKGFSFIDNDRIRIKLMGKRSPKSVDLYGPYDLTTILWIDSETFYFAAKERQHSNLFFATIHGDIFRLTLSDHNEYFYPQKIDQELFFIEKTETGDYSIMKAPFPSEVLKRECEKAKSLSDFKTRLELSLEGIETQYQSFLELEKAEQIISFKERSLAFLTMKSDKLGFFLEHSEHIDRHQETMEFCYHMLFKQDGTWKSEPLIHFTLPLHFLLPKRGRTRLYESILPLLPYYDPPDLYYLDYSPETDVLNVFSYNLETKTVTRKTDSHIFGQSFFTPRTINGRIFCGGTLITGIKKNGSPLIEIDDFGTQHFSFLEL